MLATELKLMERQGIQIFGLATVINIYDTPKLHKDPNYHTELDVFPDPENLI